MIAEKPPRKLKYRSIFISDMHLGFRGCQADSLLNFLHSTKSDYLYAPPCTVNCSSSIDWSIASEK